MYGGILYVLDFCVRCRHILEFWDINLLLICLLAMKKMILFSKNQSEARCARQLVG